MKTAGEVAEEVLRTMDFMPTDWRKGVIAQVLTAFADERVEEAYTKGSSDCQKNLSAMVAEAYEEANHYCYCTEKVMEENQRLSKEQTQVHDWNNELVSRVYRAKADAYEDAAKIAEECINWSGISLDTARQIAGRLRTKAQEVGK